MAVQAVPATVVAAVVVAGASRRYVRRLKHQRIDPASLVRGLAGMRRAEVSKRAKKAPTGVEPVYWVLQTHA
jgi:hypothetical protein